MSNILSLTARERGGGGEGFHFKYIRVLTTNKLLREKGRSEERLVLEMGEEGWRQEPRRKQGVFLKTHLPIQHALRLVSGFKPGSTPLPLPPNLHLLDISIFGRFYSFSEPIFKSIFS